MLKTILHQLSQNPKTLFLIDGIGALLSAFLLGIVLTYYNSVIGMPENVLYFLAILPCFFAVYDFVCYFKFPKKWRFFLRIIAFANLMYCGISLFFLLHHSESLTNLGWLYFSGEVIIVCFLAVVELKIAKMTNH